MKSVKTAEKIAMKLTAAERTLLLGGAVLLPPAFVRLIESTSPSEPLTLLPDSLVAFSTYVGIAAGQTSDSKPKKKLEAISQKILGLLSDHRSATLANVHNPKNATVKSVQAIASPKKSARIKKPTGTVDQFKITLLRADPPIWRRIQVQDCTLDKLHEHIQTAMGWTNSHLNQFKIGEQRYADPMLMEEDFEEFGYQDSTTTQVADILPKNGKRFRFVYEYDFGDSWDHEVLFEGIVQVDPKAKYPLCVEGGRACPPEDCGGVWGYGDLLEAIRNPKHEQHDELLEWVGGRFDSEDFDAAIATKAMRKGLKDWRRMAGW